MPINEFRLINVYFSWMYLKVSQKNPKMLMCLYYGFILQITFFASVAVSHAVNHLRKQLSKVLFLNIMNLTFFSELWMFSPCSFTQDIRPIFIRMKIKYKNEEIYLNIKHILSDWNSHDVIDWCKLPFFHQSAGYVCKYIFPRMNKKLICQKITNAWLIT